MKEKFESWMSREGQKSGKKYKPNTITTYSKAIEKLSEHYSQQKGTRVNIYKLDCLNDVKELNLINKAYSLSGIYSIIGETGHGTYRNAIANYVRFIESLNERNTSQKKEVINDTMENFTEVKPKYKINLFGIELFPKKEVKNKVEIKNDLSSNIEVSNHESSYTNTILPIELIPNNNEVFLETLLKTKTATITTFYKNGKQGDKIWDASKMTAESNVLGNLRSRAEFRKPNWQKANIVKVVVEVIQNNKAEPEIQNAPIKTRTNQGRLDGEQLFVSYFILDKNWYGQNKIITVTFIGVKYDGEIFKYYHDDVYKNTISHYSKLKCWRNYGRFSNSSNIPEIAKPFLIEI